MREKERKMAETLTEGTWRWAEMIEDLERAGLNGVLINPSSLSDDGCSIGGQTKDGIKFLTTWIKDCFLLISMTKKDQAIIDAFSKVVEYKPFAEYYSVKSGLYTVEWDKKNPKSRFKELQQKREKNLRRI